MKQTRRTKLFAIAHGILCAVPAGLLGYLVGGFFGQLMALILGGFCLFGNARFGLPRMDSLGDLKTGLMASATWPYLFWKQLDQHLQDPSTATYNAFVNGVFVGTLTDTDYARIKRQVLRDPHIYVGQALNVGKVTAYAFSSFFNGIPIAAFWGLVMLAYFDPEIYNSVLNIVQVGPSAIREAIGKYLFIAIQFWGIALIMLSVMYGNVAGFENRFGQAVNRLLRQALKVAADGDVVLASNAGGMRLSSEKPMQS